MFFVCLREDDCLVWMEEVYSLKVEKELEEGFLFRVCRGIKISGVSEGEGGIGSRWLVNRF